MTLTIYDAAMAGVLVAGMIWGAWRGVTWQLASIASLVLGYMVSHQLSVQLAPHFPGDPVVSRALAMMAVYAGVSGGVFLVAWAFRAVLKRMKFEAFDRHLGMLLGGMEGALLGILATFFVVSLAPSTREPIFSSPSGKVVGSVMNAIGPVLPSEAREALAPFIAEAKQAIATGEKVLPLLPLPQDAPTERAKEANAGTAERR
jgi:membrane protein required for colicin V production